jgi:hypothetical protein
MSCDSLQVSCRFVFIIVLAATRWTETLCYCLSYTYFSIHTSNTPFTADITCKVVHAD